MTFLKNCKRRVKSTKKYEDKYPENNVLPVLDTRTVNTILMSPQHIKLKRLIYVHIREMAENN